MLPAPYIIICNFGIPNLNIIVILTLHWHGKPKRAIRPFNLIAVVKILSLVLHVVKIAKGIDQRYFMKQAKPWEVNWLMGGQDHRVDSVFLISSSMASFGDRIGVKLLAIRILLISK